MTVVNPTSISGITSITTGTGSDNLLTIHTGDTTERFRIDGSGNTRISSGIVTTFTATTGIVTTLTANTIGIGSDNPSIELDILNTSSSADLSLRNTTNSFNSFIFDANRTAADTSLSLIDAKWNGNVVSRIQFKTGSDTTNKDDGAIALHTRTSGSALSESVRIDTAGNVGINSTSPVSKLDVIGDAKVSGIVTATAFVPTQGQLSNRNLIINGAMKIAQRATSSTDGDGYNTVDRYRIKVAGTDEAITQTQHALTSSDTGPWEEGFRHSWHFQNGNQTSGAGADDVVAMQHRIEAQNVATSGWDYTSSSSYLTLSFWVKSSVAQNFYGHMRSLDGTAQNYPFETGSLSANTWTKITKVIPGNSNITVDNNIDYGIHLEWVAYRGTNQTGSVSLNTWAAYSSTARNPDCTSTWWTTNDSTFEITGVQLEVGAAATPFEHLTFGDELLRCQRYYQQLGSTDTNLGGDYTMLPGYTYYNGQRIATSYVSNVKMRTTPTIAEIGNGLAVYGQGTNANVATIFNINTATDTNVIIFSVDGDSSKDWGAIDHAMAVTNNTGGGMSFSAEL